MNHSDHNIKNGVSGMQCYTAIIVREVTQLGLKFHKSVVFCKIREINVPRKFVCIYGNWLY